jgi:hypothetical protein
MDTYGPIYEAYIDAYIKEFTCSREVAEQSLKNMMSRISQEGENDEG